MRFPLLVAVGGACLVLLLTACSDQPDPGGSTPSDGSPGMSQSTGASDRAPHPYVGMWVTADGFIRQELRADGRYDEARGNRQSAYTGSYRVTGNQIDYVDDTGFTADGTFDGDVLHHGGYVFYREHSEAHRRATEVRSA
jgi:hypothetical protein